MSKYLTLATAFLFFFLFNRANAQTDTTHYDLGRIVLKKDFTQGITIKGSDLEHYQITDLGQAINVWAYGTYTSPSNLIYVVDGNIITDPNTYSIYDIDEVTLVQNAVAQVSGASPYQQLVVIKTKTNRPGKQGIEAAAQTGLLDLRNKNNQPGYHSSNNIYDNLHLNGYKNFDNTTIGLSADYQHDVLPGLFNRGYTFFDAFHYGRFKLNGYAETKLWKGSRLSITAGYTPQSDNYGYDNNSPAKLDPTFVIDIRNRSEVATHLINSAINLNSQIVHGLTNHLSLSYSQINYFEKDTTFDGGYYSNSPVIPYHYTENVYEKTSNLLISDRLAYDLKLGGWELQPAVNISYRHIKDTANSFEGVSYGAAATPGNTSYNWSGGKYKIYWLTPSLDLSYLDIFDIQGGMMALLNPKDIFAPAYNTTKLFPYLTASAKIISSANTELHLFASFSRQNIALDDTYSALPGFSLQGMPNQYNLAFSSITPSYIPTSSNFSQDFNNYNLGLIFRLLKKLKISYSFEYRNYLTSQQISIFSASNSIESVLALVNSHMVTNRFGINYASTWGRFTWESGLNTAESKLQTSSALFPNSTFNVDYLGKGHRWSGGFVNRFALSTWFAGIDLLYQIGERPYDLLHDNPNGPDYIAPSGNNSFSLQNLYIGKKFTIPGTKGAELYISTRNILQNKSSNITDERRFYGVGFKCGI